MKLNEYRGPALDAILARSDETVRVVISRMNAAGLRLLPVVDREGRFEGVLADGDVRRMLGSGGDAGDPVSRAMNRNPIIIHQDPGGDREVRSAMLRRGVEYLPLVIEGRVVALYSLWLTSIAREMTAVVMAGGLGQRLSPLTDCCPKPLLDLGGKPILSHIIDHLRDHGVSRFVLSLNYLADMFVDHYGDGSSHDIAMSYVRETSRLGTGGALSLIDPDTLSDPFLCLNGDLLNDLDLPSLLAGHQAGGWEATMVTRTHGYTVPYGVVRIGEDGTFNGSDEKPTLQFPINAGIYMLSKSVLKDVPKGVFFDMPCLFESLRQQGRPVGTYQHEGRWIDIGTISELTRARKIFEDPIG
ncbi:nucleotidyltransferase family protein [Pseudogemmobacter faecipullorum]|uniref:NTP transferase domain-containing protein n=1 Tax=Pseudogemmobacter faecipullorum TaxID=2755041 RepID=A0ABS8CGY9_9RHOB|nr:nucleotidyltransferase family protein [Pseudogemmobacter faecipullorum]MCB5408450.1 NTP transferase domain-containing protein [Pseudogemmobacter faecipullorum]